MSLPKSERPRNNRQLFEYGRQLAVDRITVRVRVTIMIIYHLDTFGEQGEGEEAKQKYEASASGAHENRHAIILKTESIRKKCI